MKRMDFLILIFCLQGFKIVSSDLVIVIVSQSDPYHKAHAELLQKNIYNQAVALEKFSPVVILTHELQIKGSWTYSPLFPYLSLNYPNKKWFLFCLENTVINLQELIKVLSEYNSKNMWISYGLTDSDLTIIHHFVNLKAPFKYPNEASGFAMTKDFLESFVTSQENSLTEFSIDSSHELAHYVEDKIKGPRLTHSKKFCIVSNRNCATFPRQFYPCDKPILNEKIYVAVKTCKQFRNDRIPIILNTWSKYAKNIGFYTDEEDSNLANSYVVPKTNSGHCAKTYGILQHAHEIMQEKNIDWLLITDDDTLLSLARIQKLLTCYNSKNFVALGQRYGFRLRENDGYDYLTSGAGLILSKHVVKVIINSKDCYCPYREAADDMFLFGQCLQNVGINITHSPAFHQARPTDYATGYLSSYEAVSFHSFWNINPEEIYRQWFAEDDEKFFHPHTEL